MGRPIGSKNKVKSSGGLQVLKFDKQIENAPIVRNSAMGWVQYGSHNTYPYDLISLYNTSVTHRACVDFATNAIVGDGIDIEAMKLKDTDLQAPNYQTSWNEFIRSLAFDYVLYNAFSFQIIRSKGGGQYTFYHQPIETIRLEEADEDGVINNAYICKDWSATGKYPPVKIPMFGFQKDEVIPIGQPYLYYFKPYNPVNYYYGLPVYSSALNCIQAEAAYCVYDYKSISNGFTAVGAITLPDVETEEERRALIRDITNMFTGEQNAASFVINFRNNPEDLGITFTPFTQANNSSVNMYMDANNRTVDRICAAHKITSKALIGFPVDNTGFSDSGNYLEAAFALYNINIANGNRRAILDAINSAFRLNGIETEVILKPLRYKTDDAQTTVNSSPSQVGEANNEDNVTEREENTL